VEQVVRREGEAGGGGGENGRGKRRAGLEVGLGR